MVNSTEFGKRLQKILDFYGLSATAFSETIDFNRSTISHLLSGRNRPSLDFVMKVLKNFPEVELYWLLNGTGSFPATRKDSLPSSLKEPIIDTKDDQIRLNPSEFNDTERKSPLNPQQKDIEQIILLFKDGSFKVFEN